MKETRLRLARGSIPELRIMSHPYHAPLRLPPKNTRGERKIEYFVFSLSTYFVGRVRVGLDKRVRVGLNQLPISMK